MSENPALRIVLIYLAVATGWIVVTDSIVTTVIGDSGSGAFVQTAKGVLFVLVTALVLYLLAARAFRNLRQARDDAADNARTYESLVSSIDDIVVTMDPAGRYTSIAGRAVEGFDTALLVGKTPAEVFGPDVGAVYQRLHERVMQGQRESIEWFADSAPPSFEPRNAVTALRISLSPLRDPQGEIVGTVGVGEDISALHELEQQKHAAQEQLVHLAHYDDLTGLPNRALLQDRLWQALAVAERDGHMVGLYFVDLDEFKDINDTLGHAAGDEALKLVAQRLRQVTRRADTLARLAGDEFVIVQAAPPSVEGIAHFADRIVESFLRPFDLDGQEIYATCSVGVAVYPDDGETVSDLFRAADTAMYAAKDAGRRRFEFFRPEFGAASRDRLELTNELRRAVEDHAIQVAFQPIVRTSDGSIVGLEALARFTSPTRGPVSPAVFIPIAESTGLVWELGERVRDIAFGWLRQWRDAGHDLYLSVNISAVSFRRDGFETALRRMAAEHQVPTERITLEVTETTLVEETKAAGRVMDALHAAGFRIAVDDFGTGYSMLASLRHMALSILKVDQGLVADLETDSRNRALVKTAITLGHDLDLLVVAEGVETEGQRRFLTDAGADFLQGYLFARPMPPEEVMAYLETHPPHQIQ